MGFMIGSVCVNISIHTLRMEGDVQNVTFCLKKKLISIHTLRMEGDVVVAGIFTSHDHFNPHPPHGG